MTLKKLTVFLFLIPLFSFKLLHEYYVSVTKIDFVKEKKAVQITSRLFTDDLESALRQQYGDTLRLNSKQNEKLISDYIGSYIKKTLFVTINGNPKKLNFIGNEYDLDVVISYMEIENVEQITTLKVSNKILYDVYSNQENIVRTHINSKNKTFILNKDNLEGIVKF